MTFQCYILPYTLEATRGTVVLTLYFYKDSFMYDLVELIKIIEEYLKVLVINKKSEDIDDIEISPFIKSMSTGHSIPDDLDYKKEYHEYLEKK